MTAHLLADFVVHMLPRKNTQTPNTEKQKDFRKQSEQQAPQAFEDEA